MTEAPLFGQRIAGVSGPPCDGGEILNRMAPADPSRVVARFGVATHKQIDESVAAARRVGYCLNAAIRVRFYCYCYYLYYYCHYCMVL